MSNKIELIGNLVKAITKTDKASFATIAINHSKEATTYIDFMIVGKDNIIQSEMLKKGDFIKVKAFFVNYKDKDAKTKLGILANEVSKIEKKTELEKVQQNIQDQQELTKDVPWENFLL